MTDAILAGAVLAAMAAMAVHDARRALIDPRTVLALLAAAAAWRFFGTSVSGTSVIGDGAGEGDGTWPRLVGGVLGGALGVACTMGPIGVAAALGRRWPLYPGDAMMLGALGFMLGVPGLAWTMLLGSVLALAHRFCVQRKRGRPFRKGLVPLGPGMCAGAAVVFVCIECGVALAGSGTGAQSAGAALPEQAAVTLVPETLVPETLVPETVAPLPGVSGTSVFGAVDPVRLPATELGPALAPLPPALAGHVVSFEATEPLPFPALVRRLAAQADVTIRIEERPARIAGGGTVLADPPPLRISWQGTLAGLLDRVGAMSGYSWSWQTLGPETLAPETLAPETLGPRSLVPGQGAVVFHRYWDVAQRGPEAAAGGIVPDGGASEAPGGTWTVDPAEHRTLRGVLEDWAAQAGWTLVWNAERDYGLGAPASFSGGFLEAADLLLSGPATRRTLAAMAYEANRHLVVDDADGAGW